MFEKHLKKLIDTVKLNIFLKTGRKKNDFFKTFLVLHMLINEHIFD